MKILFTKTEIDKKLVSNILGDEFSCCFVEVIETKAVEVEPFDLEQKSIIFTSVKGAKFFFQNGFQLNENSSNKIYCVGEKTKFFLEREKGIKVFRTEKNASDLVNFIIKYSENECFLHFCSDLVLDVINEGLELQNIKYEKIPVYKTELLNPVISEDVSAIVFFSPSGVRSFMENNSLQDKMIFSIGETTTAELKRYTNQPIFTSSENSLDDLLNIIKTNKNL
ncbi:MAG: uroporphyrinogen-III synthase [Bergeyella zoohelcum]|nr:uroporphyrinogen-III synthase [Bergeyella zoohelcum]